MNSFDFKENYAKANEKKNQKKDIESKKIQVRVSFWSS